MTPQSIPDKMYILHAIDLVLNQCIASQLQAPDVAVGQEILGLQNVRKIVEQEWPLTPENKARLNIGVVAVKNISDWNQDLALSLMTIDHVLKYDGDSLYRLLGPPPT
jgi:hypothetical protein